MAAVSKLVIGIIGIISAIIVLATVVPAQIQQQQATSNLIQQDQNQLNNADLKLVGDCETFQSVADLTGCKTQLNNLKSECQMPTYSSMSVCTDPRIDQFLSTVDSKIAYAQSTLSTDSGNLNAVYLKTLDQCSVVNDSNSLSSCKAEMTQIQQSCTSMSALNIPACNDPRIGQILERQITQPSNIYDSASQSMESFINLCMIAKDNSTIQDCSTKAKQMITMCQSTSVQACSDPRLQQIANMEQTTNPTSSLTTSPTAVNQTTFNSTNAAILSALNECSNNAISNSTVCMNGLNAIKQECQGPLKPYLSYVPACNDSRLQ